MGRRFITRLAGIAAVGILLAAGPAAAADEKEKERAKESQNTSLDSIRRPLKMRIDGKASLDDVRVDVFWLYGGKPTNARVYGNGVGIWQRTTQFRLTREEVIAILKAIEKARFGAMPSRFGEDAEDGEKDDKDDDLLRLTGRVILTLGEVTKEVVQLGNGGQSKELASLAVRILDICAGPAKRGVGAASMADALRQITASDLAPETLEVIVQRRVDARDKDSPQAGWIVRLNGRRVIGESTPGEPRRRELLISDKEAIALAALLAENDPSALPQSVYAATYTDVAVSVLNFKRTITGRKFLGMTPEGLGAKQQAFDRIVEAFRALRERTQKEGRALAALSSPAAADSKRTEEDREKKKRERKDPTL